MIAAAIVIVLIMGLIAMQIKPGYLVGYYLEGKHQIAVVQAVKCDRVVVEGGELLIADLVPTVLEICVMDGCWNQVQKK